MNNRKILVLSKEKDYIFNIPFFYYDKNDIDIKDLVEKHTFSFVERDLAEQDNSKKQIIPYIVVKDSNGRFFTYKRKGKEKRLHGFFSIGAGGHVDLNDIIANLNKSLLKFKNIEDSTLEKDKFNLDIDDFFEIIKLTLLRELYEEVGIKIDKNDFDKKLKFLGIINEEISSVGKVHLGFVYLYEILNNEKITLIDKEIDFFEFYDPIKIQKIWDSLEKWSILALSLLNINKTLLYISDKNLNLEKKANFFNNHSFTEFIEFIDQYDDIVNFKIFLDFIISSKNDKKLYFYVDNEEKFSKINSILHENGLIKIN